ncbi:replication protein A [Methanobacterium sp. CWC-01]|jgi:replication factor A1|uniref:OB-fold nucleic acid binding domain-containing protein n=1 Tax=Methanobacterium aridiramus TaxID=2584467 RepID=UPI002575EEE9|nr:OB-fold nucleic acid binding domain-containing protein [Methanobacterium sp. CWC-01]WJI09565.1 replication protein A [Methanobacterium sp. CWC-01]
MREISEEIRQEYEKIKDKISYEDFLKKMEIRAQDYEGVSFMSELDLARVIVGEYIEEKNEPLIQESKDHKISELEAGQHNLTIVGRVMKMSNIKKFTSRKGKEGRLANIILADDTGSMRMVFWTENIKLLTKNDIREGDVIKLKGVEIKQGYREDEAHLNARSELKKLPSEEFTYLPSPITEITRLCDVQGDMEVNVIARIIRIPRIRTFDRNGSEGKVASLELQDESGKMTFTLWNRDTDLINTLDLHEGDAVKIMGAQSRVRNGEVSLNHSWIGRVEKGEFDVPEYSENVLKIGDAREMRDVTIVGVASKVYDEITFERDDGSTGRVKSLELEDDTGAIRVTLWNEDTALEIKKGDIIKIIGGNIEFDDYSTAGYRINTNWNSKILINPPIDAKLKEMLHECGKYLKPFKIGELNQIEDEGDEVDVVGRVVNLYEPNEFQRDDGSKGVVRSAELADETGVVRVSLWEDKAEGHLNEGDAVKIENARTRLGNYNVELSVGKTSRILKPSPEEMEKLPSVKEVADMLYQDKKITELTEGDREARILGRILSLYEPREFTREDGSRGMVRSVEIADDTGVIRASLWDDQANQQFSEGDAVRIANPRVTLRNDVVEISAGRTTQVTRVKDEESDLPALKDIQEKIYPSKKIDEIEEDLRNIRVSGEIMEAFGNKILFEMCPTCNKRVIWEEDTYVCEVCGEEVENPEYLMIISILLEDDTGTIRTTFFRQAAEDLLGISTKEAEEIIDKTGDEGSLEEKVVELVGRQIKIIADAGFDEYNEEVRLNAKKVLEIKI